MKYYLLDVEEQQIGPFTIEQLKERGLNRKTKVWCEGMDDWTEAQSVDELKENIDLPPPPPKSQSQISKSSYQKLPFDDPLIYDPDFKIDSISEALMEECKKHSFREPFSVGLGIFLHYITLGIFTFIHCGLMHSKLPEISHKDFSAGKAIGFRFIPIYNIYWIFVFWEQLARRINFQFKIRNVPKPISVALADWTCVMRVLGIIPYVGYVTASVAIFILFPILFSQVRSACNKLAVERFN